MPLFGPPNIDKLEAQRNVGSLIRALRHEDPGIRCRAAEALGRLQARSAVAEHSDKQVRKASADALAKLLPGNEATRLSREGELRAHIRFLLHGDASARAVAASALGAVGGVGAVEPLMAALEDSDKAVRKAAAAALGRVLPREEAADLAREAEIRVLAGQLRHGELKQREGAATALGATGDVRAVDPLLAVLNQHEDGSLRWAAARALARLGEGGIEALITVVGEATRWRAFFHHPYHNWSDQTSEFAYDGVRVQAAAALAESSAVRAWGDTRARATGAMANALVGRGRGPLRDGLTQVLMKLGYTASAVARLEREAREVMFAGGNQGAESGTGADQASGSELADKAGSVETHAVPELLALLGEAFDTNDRRTADRITRKLAKAGADDVPGLAAGLDDQNALVRWTVTQILAEVGGSEVLPTLRSALEDTDEGVREAASVAIERIDARHSAT